MSSDWRSSDDEKDWAVQPLEEGCTKIKRKKNVEDKPLCIFAWDRTNYHGIK